MNAGKGKGILAVMMAAVLASCSASVPQPTMEELLAEVNAEHQEVEKSTIDISQYVGDLVDEDLRWSYYPEENTAGYDPEKILTQQQAIEDVTYLFDAFHDCYGPYVYFGGAEVFDAAEEAIKTELQTKETLTAADLERLLLENLTFIQDGHFSINNKSSYMIKIPFFFREVAFVKTEEGYQTTDGREVESVEGYDHLDKLMKRSISPEGKLVYYPVLLKDNDPSTRLDLPQSCDETLTVHYANKTKQELTAEPFQIYSETFLKTPEEYQIVTSRQNEEIPVFQFNDFDLNYKKEILEGAAALRDEPIAILDLRSNRGGSALIAEDWLSKYANTSVLLNGTTIDTKTGEFLRNEEDKWIENPNILIILSGKYSASASEMMIDCAYNLENVLIIGENTMGALLGGQGSTCLPSSAIKVGVGNGLLSLQAEGDYFKELRGFYPDIWVPAAEAEELAVKLIENLK